MLVQTNLPKVGVVDGVVSSDVGLTVDEVATGVDGSGVVIVDVTDDETEVSAVVGTSVGFGEVVSSLEQ